MDFKAKLLGKPTTTTTTNNSTAPSSTAAEKKPPRPIDASPTGSPTTSGAPAVAATQSTKTAEASPKTPLGTSKDSKARSPHLQKLEEQWFKEQEAMAAQVITDDSVLGFKMPGSGDCSKASVFPDLPALPGQEDVPPTIVKKTVDATVGDDSLPELKLVGGVDISFVKDSNVAVAALVILTYPELKVVHTAMSHCEMTVPYIPGFLAFREVPALLPLIEELKKEKPELVPQVIVVDGNGVHHYRRCGLASHLGVLADIPTIGAAKKLLAVDGLSREPFEAAFVEFCAKSKDNVLFPIHGNSGAFWGYAAKTGQANRKPLYISPGHRIGFASAAKLVLDMSKHHVPEPTRQADLRTREYIRNNFSASPTGTVPAGSVKPPSKKENKKK